MSDDPTPRIRRFSRAVTTALGALDHSFLGLGRPLGTARVLNAIGHGHGEVAQLRDYLGLDSGQLSRTLRGLEDEGLLTTEAGETDGRRRKARLTDAGKTEFQAYEQLSNTHALALLDGHGTPDRVLEAMEIVANALNRDRIDILPTDPGDKDALSCLQRYFAELAARFEQGYDQHLSRDPEAGDLSPPRGIFLLATSDGAPLGCVALKGTEKGYGEVKRLWVAPAARGLGLARRLMTAVEDAARDLGYDKLRLDTNSALPEAVALYQRTGWTAIERFNDDPYPDYFFEKILT
ncbi:bifunctional helix-turn-helix transcriptional regulator/GNAT family N-acetyltransferase [Pseudooceanicola algae]|uniref:Uncharacterized protein n=1 Tax=Pseudooceanicola algae TaxID=1537215 RepID=A0A418SEG5_9RHOB|nr:GNAT family N-acetyltransferase [Pseudooceanicola algae]QPM89629.1 hypothetical protein PSAL_008510 [Pseudooceanicola algae]